ncbi:hypothetical protein [Amycolatopsis cihanbeyliensis]|uniref:hypothetical protein n=1 Tax=Amycolatopsis cihanbeyliensis TaxID=1128664 RepID=UPI0014776EB5|nr:hypothetical protein [Amycolatopsis cihanbeyliensis]
MDDLWPEEPPARPESALRSKVSQPRRVPDAAEPGAREALGAEGFARPFAEGRAVTHAS